jgi:predicted enzyme related to lactoylglutathione lyase
MPKEAAHTDTQRMASGMTVYFWVDNIEEATTRIEELGGKVVMPKTKQGVSGYFSNLVDIEGNRFGIYQLVSELLE